MVVPFLLRGVLTAVGVLLSVSQGQQDDTRSDADAIRDLLERVLEPSEELKDLPTPLTHGEPRRLSLAEAVRIAIENDLSLRQEALVAEVTRFNFAGSWGAFDPIVSASVGVQDSEFEGSSSLAGASVVEIDTQSFNTGLSVPLITGGSFDLTFDRQNTETNNSFQNENPSTTDTVTLALTQPLLRGAWIDEATSDQREAELTHESQLEHYRQVRQELHMSVVDTYWDLVAASEQLQVAEATLRLGYEQKQQDQRRLEAGVGTEVEVLQADANVAVRIEERLNAGAQLGAAMDALKQMLFPGTDIESWERPIEATTSLPEEVTADIAPRWEEALATALDQRSELRQQVYQIDASELRLHSAKSDRLPGLDLRLTGSSQGFDGDPVDAFSDAAGFEFPSLGATLTFNMPLGNRTTANAVRTARAQLRSARLRYDQLASQVAGEVRTAVRDLLHQVGSVAAAKKSLELAVKQLEAEQARYREGLTTTFQVLDFQQKLASAMSSERMARVNYQRARSQLDSARGIIGETPAP